MNEYEIIKGDRQAKGAGRADLWFDNGARGSSACCYSFEAKRAWLAATPSNLQTSLASAYSDIARIDPKEFHYAAGLLLTRVRDVERIDTYEAFAQSDNVDLAYHIGPDGVDGAYLFFRLRE